MMRKSTFYPLSALVIFFPVLLMVMLFRSPAWSEEKTVSRNFTMVPTLIHSVRFSEDVYFCGSKIPLEDPDVRQRLEKEMLLALWDRPQVILWLKRSAKYFGHIESELTRSGLHPDYKYVPVIESGLRPHSRSSSGAVGFWQFIGSTGRRYGLRIDSRTDERRHLIKSTEAACKYLLKLQEQFGSSFLALAAYNMGEYGLAAEIKAQETKEFFSLYLPLETQRYILKLAAAKLIMESPEKYGFYLTPADYYPLFSYDKVQFDSTDDIPVVLIARAAGVSFKAIKDLNPDIRGYHVKAGKLTVFVPKGSAESFRANFPSLFADYRDTHLKRFHVVKKGESLTSIARQYDISLTSLLKWNNLQQNSVIHPGNRLVVSAN